MRAFLLISHGFYSEALKESLKMIAGNVDCLYAICLEPNDGPEEFKNKIITILPVFDKYEKVIVFADLFGGCPLNTAFQTLINYDKFQFIAGMNFPMILSAILNENSTIEDIINDGKQSIIDVRKYTSEMFTDDED